MIKAVKLLGYKAYGSIPHLPGSRLGEGDHHCHEGQARIATEKVRDKHDIVIVQEKLDGSCCSVAKINGEIIALGRSGYEAKTSEYPVHHIFAEWVEENKERFHDLLFEGERVVGEWLAMAVGTKYILPHEPFVIFDIMLGKHRASLKNLTERVLGTGFIMPTLLSIGNAISINEVMDRVKTSGHGAIDPVEGAIWRVERKGEVDFLTKFVRHDKEDGKYFPEKNNGVTTWNIDVSKYKIHAPA
jgi:hypothetical protein